LSGEERDDPRCPAVSTTSAETVYHAQVQYHGVMMVNTDSKIQGWFLTEVRAGGGFKMLTKELG
jgi:hypothetical protein